MTERAKHNDYILKQIPYSKRYIQTLIDERKACMALATSLRSPLGGGPAVKSSPAPEASFTSNVEKAVDLDRKLERMINNEADFYAKVMEALGNLPTNEAYLIKLRYFDGESWLAIGELLGCDRRIAKRWCEEILDRLGELQK